jgi:antitoxin (DNA-binding transcriptional repressor) of toxin-antitoxin stability system
VREKKEVFTVTLRGRVVAQLVPVADTEKAREEDLKVLAEMRTLAGEIGKYLPSGTSAVEAIREQRREL